jgi:hypothetical protein
MATLTDEQLRALRFLARAAHHPRRWPGANGNRLGGDHRRRTEGDRGVIVPLRLRDGLDPDAPTNARSAARSILPTAAAAVPRTAGRYSAATSPHSGAASDDNVANHAIGAVNRSLARLQDCSAVWACQSRRATVHHTSPDKLVTPGIS